MANDRSPVPPQLRPPTQTSPNGASVSVGSLPVQLNVSGVIYHRLTIQANPTNVSDLGVGSALSPSVILTPGGIVTLEDVAPNNVWLLALTGSVNSASWLGYGFHRADEVFE